MAYLVTFIPKRPEPWSPRPSSFWLLLSWLAVKSGQKEPGEAKRVTKGPNVFFSVLNSQDPYSCQDCSPPACWTPRPRDARDWEAGRAGTLIRLSGVLQWKPSLKAPGPLDPQRIDLGGVIYRSFKLVSRNHAKPSHSSFHLFVSS